MVIGFSKVGKITKLPISSRFPNRQRERVRTMWFDLMNELTLESESEREGKTMSAKREKRRRVNLRLEYIAAFYA